MNVALRTLVRRRARFRCEYCGLPEAYAPVLPLHVEHVVPRKHGTGTFSIDDLLGRQFGQHQLQNECAHPLLFSAQT